MFGPLKNDCLSLHHCDGSLLDDQCCVWATQWLLWWPVLCMSDTVTSLMTSVVYERHSDFLDDQCCEWATQWLPWWPVLCVWVTQWLPWWPVLCMSDTVTSLMTSTVCMIDIVASLVTSVVYERHSDFLDDQCCIWATHPETTLYQKQLYWCLKAV